MTTGSMMLATAVSQLPSYGQSIADILLAFLTLYTFLSVRSGGLRKKRDRDRRMDQFLNGVAGDDTFDAIPAAPARLAALETTVKRLERTNKLVVQGLSDVRQELAGVARAAGVIRRSEEQKAREK